MSNFESAASVENLLLTSLPEQILFMEYPFGTVIVELIKDIYSCQIGIIKGLTDKGQFQYLTKLKGPSEGTEGTYMYTTQFLSAR